MYRPVQECLTNEALYDASQKVVQRAQAALNGIGSRRITLGSSRYDVSRSPRGAAIVRSTIHTPRRSETVDASFDPETNHGKISYIGTIQGLGRQPVSVYLRDSPQATHYALRLVERLEQDTKKRKKD